MESSKQRPREEGLPRIMVKVDSRFHYAVYTAYLEGNWEDGGVRRYITKGNRKLMASLI